MKKGLLSLLLCLLLLLTSACAETAEETVIVTSFYPVYILAQNVLKDVEGVTVRNMAAPSTGCLHDYQLLAGDMRALAQADCFIINGAGMEGFLPKITAQFPDLPVVDSSLGVTLLPDEHEGGDNAHIWLDPDNAILMTQNIASGLCALLPDDAAVITANANAYAQRLRALDEEIASALSTLKSRNIVTFHEAFPYFAKAYDLNVVAVVALEPDEALSPSQLKTLVDTVKAAGNPPLFTEPQYQSDAALTVAAETGAMVYELDPIVTGDGSADAYETVMRLNAQTLLGALGGEE